MIERDGPLSQTKSRPTPPLHPALARMKGGERSGGTRQPSTRSAFMDIREHRERKLIAMLRASASLHFPDPDEADAEVERVLLAAIKEAQVGLSHRDRKRQLLRIMNVPS
ncbi:hypothetical protein LAC81_28980 [Ensifer adhaerens]|uniref:hypothetical protein n=1 Tax=Ensifer adhaerens TaxID=106592 RepID=UPI001CC0EDDC|nr:hypothetical protein [Ensifer adhaerens]MBZ7924775.1 hypothetical protein [Ensifer adhaerens]UAX96002.1 hypothetical protein LAC78_34850 [Ensifer adhaerens]UAY04657.1 hypothetical protein LAC80_25460 [Ensifer adhaerens]UAY10088.1 hypothetical protein LAC81_28980 [Ensifer adhaerens]